MTDLRQQKKIVQQAWWIILLVAAIVSFGLFWYAQAEVQRNGQLVFEQYQKETLKQYAGQINTALQRAERIAILLAKSASMQEFETQTTQLRAAFPGFSQAVIIENNDSRDREVQAAMNADPNASWSTDGETITYAKVIKIPGQAAKRAVLVMDLDASVYISSFLMLEHPSGGRWQFALQPNESTIGANVFEPLEHAELALVLVPAVGTSTSGSPAPGPGSDSVINGLALVLLAVAAGLTAWLNTRERYRSGQEVQQLSAEVTRLQAELADLQTRRLKTDEQWRYRTDAGEEAAGGKAVLQDSPAVDMLADVTEEERNELFEADQSLLKKKSLLSSGEAEDEELHVPYGKGEMIFIVDDDEMGLMLTSRHLHKHGYRVEKFTTGNDFLRVFAIEGKPAAVLLDVMLPDCDGFFLAKKIREQYSPLELPIIFLSGRGELPDVISGFERGANDYLIKPVAKNELLVRLRIQIRLSQWGIEMKDAILRRGGSIKALMDHSEQGFISLASDLIVSDEHSLACNKIFGREIRNTPLVELLEPNQPAEAELLNQILTKLFSEPNSPSRDILLGLLPTHYYTHKRSLTIDYKILDNDNGYPHRLLIFITDQTESEKLKMRIAQEQMQLKMVVKVVTKRRDFVELLQQYFDFCDSWADEMSSDSKSAVFILGDILRQIHTFKGNFSQYEMNGFVTRLHDFETVLKELAEKGPVDFGKLHQTMSNQPLRSFVQEDLDVILRTLGPKFLERSDDVSIRRPMLRAIEDRALSELPDAQREAFVTSIRSLYYQPVKELLSHYPAYVQQLSQRMDKSVHPFEVEGDLTLVDPVVIEPFIQSLIHIFRNSVDHGIESYEDRIEFGKDGNAHISCTVKEQRDGLLIEVRDDGKGISVNRVKRRAVELNVISEQVAAAMNDMQILDLIFHEQFTTKRQVSEVSGRGIGLSAVRQAVQQMGGTIQVQSTSGEGTTVSVRLPWGRMFVRQTEGLMLSPNPISNQN